MCASSSERMLVKAFTSSGMNEYLERVGFPSSTARSPHNFKICQKLGPILDTVWPAELRDSQR